MSSNDERERSQEANLQGLLRLAVSNTATNPDQQINPRTMAMDSDRREFLQNVLSNLAPSAVEDMKNCLNILKNNLNLISSDSATETTYEEIENILENLTELTSSIDTANDFEKIGGFSILKSLLGQSNTEVLCATAGLIAELVQNNPYCQKAALEISFLPNLANLLDTHSEENVRIKALYALSCLIRQNVEAQKIFEENDGFSILLRAMQSNVQKLKIKIAFLLASICSEQPEYRDVLFKMGFVEQLIAMLHLEHDDSHEHLFSALFELASQHEPSLQECKNRAELGLYALLQDRIHQFKGLDKHQDECEKCEKLMEICYATKNQIEIER